MADTFFVVRLVRFQSSATPTLAAANGTTVSGAKRKPHSTPIVSASRDL
jgi:hypothetical protein